MCHECDPKLLFCTEARITSDIVHSEYKIDGFTAIVCHAQSRFTGGVIVYVKNSLKVKVIENIYIEKLMWCLTIELLENPLNGIYSVIYRSPAYNLNDCYEFFDKFLENTVNLNKLNVIVGDININMNEINANSRSLNFLFDKHGIEQIVDFNTRVNNNSETLIDYVLTNNSQRVSCEILQSEKITDHETITIKIEGEKTETHSYGHVLSWSNYNKIDLIENLRSCDWSNFEQVNIDYKLNILRENILSSVSSLVKSVTIKNTLKPKKWFDNELKVLKQEKNEKRKNWSLNKCDSLWQEYVIVRNVYNSQIKAKKTQYTRTQILNASCNQKQMWKCLNELISNKNNKTSDEIVFEDEACTDTNTISEKFNAFFVNSIIDLNRSIPEPSSNIFEVHEQCEHRFKFELTTIDQVTKIANQLTKKVNKSELNNSQVWFDSIEYTGYFITKIINESLSSGYFPEAWKTSTVVPIPKITNTKKAAEHRGINMLPIDEKICEIIVKEQLVDYIETNSLLSTHQSAFRANHSCESAINFVINDWKVSMEDGNFVITVFIDLRRAFETVDREKMSEKLQAIGIDEVELEWFRSYLTARKQQTKFKNSFSSEIDVPIGLPQGATLGVILFNVYIDSITKVVQNSSIVLFADDTAVVVKNKDLNTAIMNRDLNIIAEWLKKNKLMLNTQKTSFMILSKYYVNGMNFPNVTINGDLIERVKEVKYLGIKIDDKLTFKEQTASTTKKAASKTNLLFRVSKNLTFDTKKVIFNSIVMPAFQYCSTIYLASNKEEIAQMQIIQNRAMRLILNVEFSTPIDFMLRALNLLSISQMIKFNALIYIYKMLNGLLPKYLCDNLIRTNTIHNRNTRQNNEYDLRLPNYSSTLAQKNIFYNGIKLYNDLPNEIKKSQSLNSFKEKCRKFIIENYAIL